MPKQVSPILYSVLVIDDHPLFRRGVCQLLGMDSRYQVAGEASSGEEGLHQAKSLNPDLILLDMNMKGWSGVQTLEAMRDADITARIIILTVSNAPEDLVAAIRAGSDGYILKDTDPEDMIRLIGNAMEGQDAISPELVSVLTAALRKENLGHKRSDAALTDRELCILKSLAAGKSNKLIARELDIMESTVKVHIRNLLKKLKFRSRVEAAVWAVSNQIGQ